MCQPPVNAMALIKRLSPDEMNRVLRCVAIWAPEAFEKGLQRVSEEREIVADYYREQRAGGARCRSACGAPRRSAGLPLSG
jgi:hypothetical protein